MFLIFQIVTFRVLQKLPLKNYVTSNALKSDTKACLTHGKHQVLIVIVLAEIRTSSYQRRPWTRAALIHTDKPAFISENLISAPRHH